MLIFFALLVVVLFYILTCSDMWVGGAYKKKKIYSLVGDVNLSSDLLVTYDQLKECLDFSNPNSYFLPDGHVGQRKLFIAAYQFIKMYPDTKYFIYAGSAPNKYGWLLHKEFPHMKFVYIDPRPHELVECDGYTCNSITVTRDTIKQIEVGPDTIYLITDYFDSEYAKLFNGLDCIFMCDIRSIAGEKLAEGDVCNNLSQQAVWFKLMGAKAASLKFRVPFSLIDKPWSLSSPQMGVDLDLASSMGLNIIDNIVSTGKFRYFGGKIFLQAYAGVTSAETRLVCDKDAEYIDYDNLNYEAKLFYYNIVTRNSVVRCDGATLMLHDRALELQVIGNHLSDEFTNLLKRYYGKYRGAGSLKLDGKKLYNLLYESYLDSMDSQPEFFNGTYDECEDTDDYFQYVDEDLHEYCLVSEFKSLGDSKIIVTDLVLHDEFPNSVILFVGDVCPDSYDKEVWSTNVNQISNDDDVLKLDVRLIYVGKINKQIDGLSLLLRYGDHVNNFEPMKHVVTSRHPGMKLRGSTRPSPYLEVGYITTVGRQNDPYKRTPDPRSHKSFFNRNFASPLFGQHLMANHHYSFSWLRELPSTLLERLASKYFGMTGRAARLAGIR
jgi:hypothetical protein